ncbi:MAG TPA: BatD family protein [Verrucomicrobiae bacterium]|jgi:tetratricopeptide (TPR) repeat protein|nr:BatD family protein [Verrucomicrobiae bacterium]
MMSLLWRAVQSLGLRPGIPGWSLCLLALLTLSVQAGNFDATLDRNQIGMGESAVLTLTISGGSVTTEPALPAIPGLDIRSSGTQTEINFDGMHMVRKTVYTFEMSPTTPGSFVIPPIQAGVDGQTLATRPLRLTVTKGTPAAAPGSGPAFVQLAIPKTNLYFGEVMRVEMRCYFQAAGEMQQPVLASDGFSSGQVVNPNNRQTPPREIVNGVAYYMYTFPVAVTPNKAGRLTLGPATWELNIPSGPADIFGRRRQQHVTVTSDPMAISVSPVPPPPAGSAFTGAVGDFALADFDASPTAVSVGDPITLKLHIDGHGSFDNVVLSTNQPGWNDFKTYQPTTKFDSSDPLQMEGSKYFEQVITPLNAALKEIPAFTFTFFDPDRRAFRNLTHPPVPIVVKPSAATPQPTVISTGAPAPEEPPSREIVHIKPFFGESIPDRPALIQRPWFWAVQALAPLLWIGALLWRRQKESLANNPRLRRQRHVARLVQEGLAALPPLAAAGDHEQFYAGVFRLLQEQIGERLDLPASAITEAALEDLPRHGLDTETCQLLQELFQACNQYRYTRERTVQEMNSLIVKLRDALTRLQNLPATAAKRKSTAAPLAVFLLIALAGSASAQPASDKFSQANKLYEEAKYPEAAAAYQQLLHDGIRSVAVLFNLGNAQYKAGRMGEAIAAYRQAENLAPRDPDIRANLRFARDQVANFSPALPGSTWTRWITRVSLDEWSLAAAITLALFFLLLAARQIRPALKSAGLAAPISLAILALWFSGCLALACDQHYVQKSAVVIASESVARRGPFEESQTAFTFHDGSELLILNRQSPWVEVADAANHTGWLPEKDLAFIP